MEDSRKRPLAESSSSGGDEHKDNDNELKRIKDHDPVESVYLIPEDDAWSFDIDELLDSPTTIPSPSPTQFDGNNFKNYDPSKSLFVLCVLGNLTLPLNLLHTAFPSLLQLSPNLQALILARSPSSLSSLLASSPLSLPIVEVQGNPASHFLRLGLLHPLGGGQRPLDAIVLLDTAGRRRLVIPFGWGAGRQVGDPATGHIVQEKFVALLRASIQQLEREKTKGKKKDFYELARTYF